MNAPNDNTAPRGIRAWWASPPRSGLQFLINPWEYRNIRVFGSIRIAGGCVAAIVSVMCLAASAYAWAALFVAIAAANFAGGCWYLSIARSTSQPDPGQTAAGPTPAVVDQLRA
jgi:hypothetical protein